MSKSDEYRAHAAECQRMADNSRNSSDKQTWLELAESWLRMIRQRKLTAGDRFESRERQDGTHQPKSDASH
jgi:hypothetical protein